MLLINKKVSMKRKSVLKAKIVITCFIMILVTGCGSTSSSTRSSSNPYSCKENTELENSFIVALREQNFNKLQSAIDAGVDVNGKICNCKKVSVSMGSAQWGKMNICETKPFFIEAISLGNYKIVELFINNGVDVNQSYTIYDWGKDFGGHYNGKVKSSFTITTLEELFKYNYVDNKMLELLLSKGAKVTKVVELKAKQINDEEIFNIFKSHNITIQ